MAPKIFATGGSGYIGGAALDVIISKHPEYEVTALIRDPKKATNLTQKHPNIKTVSGTLDSTDVIESESSKADIVLHFADCDHAASAKSIIAGLSKRTTPSYFIHTSGTAILASFNHASEFGKASSETFDDIENISQITSFPAKEHPHRDVDEIVIAGNSGNLKTAIVCPPTIYGVGSGSGNTRSGQVPWMTHHILKRGEGFQVGEGKAIWSNVHIKDLSNLYLLLTEDAAAGEEKATWGVEGYYFAENGQHVWGELAKNIASKAKAKGYLKTNNVVSLSNEEVSELQPFGTFGPFLWGSNSRSTASRARKILGWKPVGPSLEETLDEVIESEAKTLGL